MHAQAVAGSVAAGLAAAYARAGVRAILVECDVRDPRLGDALGLGASSPGLTDVLAGAELAGAVRSAPAAQGQVAVLLGGSPADGAAADILGSAAAAALIDRLAGSYDVVVLAAPTLLGGADALELARLADGTVVVGRLGHTTCDEACQARDLLAGVGLEPLGLVLAAGGRVRGRKARTAGPRRRWGAGRRVGSGRRAGPGDGSAAGQAVAPTRPAASGSPEEF